MVLGQASLSAPCHERLTQASPYQGSPLRSDKRPRYISKFFAPPIGEQSLALSKKQNIKQFCEPARYCEF